MPAVPAPSANHPISAITPYLVVDPAAAAISFYEDAFGGTEDAKAKLVAPGSNKIAHDEMQIGDAHIIITDEFPEWGNFSPKSLKVTSVVLYMQVSGEPDEIFKRAVDAGAEAVIALTADFYGVRGGRIRDPFGHLWDIVGAESKEAAGRILSITPHVAASNVDRFVSVYRDALAAEPGAQSGALRVADVEARFTPLALGTEQIAVTPEVQSAGLVSAELVGNSAVQIHMAVAQDVDAVADQAVKAGAAVVIPVANQFYGARAGRLSILGQPAVACLRADVRTPVQLQGDFETFLKANPVAASV